MVILFIQLGLMGLNLYGGKERQENGQNPALSYFVAGICCMGAIHAFIKLVS